MTEKKTYSSTISKTSNSLIYFYKNKNMKKIFLILIIVVAACQKNNSGQQTTPGNYSADMVLQWNLATTNIIDQNGFPPPQESRIYAMINTAVHDALNNIVQKFNTYALNGTPVPDANPDAAVAQAAHDVTVALLPSQSEYLDSLLKMSLAPISDGKSKEDGVTVGAAAAKAMLDKRATDGASSAQVPFTQGSLPDQYRFTPPFDAPPGFAIVPDWGKVNPFGLTSSSQFRPDSPYALNSAEYAADYNEVKTLGCTTCAARSADQTQIGLFWLENVSFSWNRITRILCAQHQLDGWKTAQLLSLVHMAMADANIASFEGKYYYNFWRPYTAIRLGDTDGNDSTDGDPNWNLLAPPTPPAPDYPSNHATNAGAVSELLKQFFNTDQISFSTTSNSLPGVTRNYTSLSQAAMEVAVSRIYVGYHFRHSIDKGLEEGVQIGDFVFAHSLQAK
jgi:PAP2 superfamily